jgi:hypothetical protein
MSNDTPKPPCEKCGEPHVDKYGNAACAAHRRGIDPPLRCGKNPLAGQAVCRFHGGNTANSRKAGQKIFREKKARELGERLAVTLGHPIDISPHDLVLDQIRRSAGHMAWYLSRIQALGAEDLVRGIRGVQKTIKEGFQAGETTVTDAGPEINALVDLYNRERKFGTDLAAKAITAGIEERRVRLAESQGTLLQGGLEWLVAQAKTDARLALDDAASKALMEIIGEMLQRLDVMETAARV